MEQAIYPRSLHLLTGVRKRKLGANVSYGLGVQINTGLSENADSEMNAAIDYISIWNATQVPYRCGRIGTGPGNACVKRCLASRCICMETNELCHLVQIGRFAASIIRPCPAQRSILRLPEKA